MRTIAFALLSSLTLTLTPTAFAARSIPSAAPKRANCFDLALSAAKNMQVIGTLPKTSKSSQGTSSKATKTVEIGITLIQKTSYYYVTSVTPGSPAALAGLKPGDAIRGIDGAVLKQQYSAEELLKRLNGPAGTSIEVDIGRLMANGKTTVTIHRTATTAQAAYEAAINGPAAYVVIRSLDATTTKAIRTWLQSSEAQSAKGVILDFRPNPYGDMQSLMDLLAAALPKGTPLGTVLGAKKSQPIATQLPPVIGPQQKVVALVNEGGLSGIIVRYALRISLSPPAPIIVAAKSRGMNAIQVEQMSFSSLLKGDDVRQYCSERSAFTWDLVFKDEIVVTPAAGKDAPLERALSLLQ